tara:strand:- start:204 stop:866 length:663 start_codon:yes stop_codon:yes gene_type:complete
MADGSLNGREYAQFKSMLEEALLEISLPAGCIEADSIEPGSISPDKCDMRADWKFQGLVSINGVNVSRSYPQPQTVQTEQKTQQPTVSTSGYGNINTSTQTVVSENKSENNGAEVVFLDSLQRKVVYTLPPASKNSGKMLYVKRTDSQSNNICRIETFEDDKIDDIERIMLSTHESVVLIADSAKWHILSRYTPPQPEQQDLSVETVSNVNTKVMLLTTS